MLVHILPDGGLAAGIAVLLDESLIDAPAGVALLGGTELILGQPPVNDGDESAEYRPGPGPAQLVAGRGLASRMAARTVRRSWCRSLAIWRILLPSIKKALRICSFWSTLSTRSLRLLVFSPDYRILSARWVSFRPSQTVEGGRLLS
jgi:hypothetical protein